jgi:hypothetical protein
VTGCTGDTEKPLAKLLFKARHLSILDPFRFATKDDTIQARNSLGLDLRVRSRNDPTSSEDHRLTMPDQLRRTRRKGTPENPLIFKLPPELRNNIYRMILQRDSPIKIKPVFCRRRRKDVLRARESLGDHFLAITKTCKAIRQETWPLVFGVNEFSFKWEGEDVRLAQLDAFERQIGGKRAQGLTRVTLEVLYLASIYGTAWPGSSNSMPFTETVSQLRRWKRQNPLLSFKLVAFAGSWVERDQKDLIVFQLDMDTFEESCVRVIAALSESMRRAPNSVWYKFDEVIMTIQQSLEKYGGA